MVDELLRQLVSNERLIARLVRSDVFLDRMAADGALMGELTKRQGLLAKVRGGRGRSVIYEGGACVMWRVCMRWELGEE